MSVRALHQKHRLKSMLLRGSLFFRDLPLLGRAEVAGLHLGAYNIGLRLDVREHGLWIDAYPENQKDQRRELPGFPRVEILQPFISLIRHGAEEHPLIKPQHVGRAEDYSDGSERAPGDLRLERASD